jgi:hypothetical protein
LNATGVARAQWKFDASDWRLEEDGQNHGEADLPADSRGRRCLP